MVLRVSGRALGSPLGGGFASGPPRAAPAHRCARRDPAGVSTGLVASDATPSVAPGRALRRQRGGSWSVLRGELDRVAEGFGDGLEHPPGGNVAARLALGRVVRGQRRLGAIT